MFEQLKVYENIVVGGIVIVMISVFYFYIHGLKSKITDLQMNLKDSQIEIANYKLESTRLRNALDNQNEKIEVLKSDKQNALKTLAEWEALPPKIKYKTITKIREIHSDECKDIKAQLDAIKYLDFNSL